MVSNDFKEDYEGVFLTFLLLQPNNDLRLMQGLSLKSLKHHVALQVIVNISYSLLKTHFKNQFWHFYIDQNLGIIDR